MINKLIYGKIVEIVFISSFIVGTIPIWQTFDKKISEAKASTTNTYSLIFNSYNYEDYDSLIIRNDYYLNKSYQIKLQTAKNIDLEASILMMNNKAYNLNEFRREENSSNYTFTIIDNYIMATSNYYKVSPKLIGENTKYQFIFKEN